MKVISAVFQLLYAVAIIGIGSYGAYILFGEFVKLERFPSISQFLLIVRQRWYAFLALSIALVLFFYRLFNALSG